MNETPIRSIVISTGGGDAPRLNTVIRAVVFAAEIRGWERWGVRDCHCGGPGPEAYGGDSVVRENGNTPAQPERTGADTFGRECSHRVVTACPALQHW